MTALDRAHLHVNRFNRAVVTGDWDSFVAWFVPDGEMVLAGPEVPVLEGREAILDAYLADPPTDTMHVLAARESAPDDQDGDVVDYSWSQGGGGSMLLVWDGDHVRSLTLVPA